MRQFVASSGSCAMLARSTFLPYENNKAGGLCVT